MNEQTKEHLDAWWSTPDAWGYKTNPHDAKRKEMILRALQMALDSEIKDVFDKALDIGAGEGFVTKDLPAKTIHAIELSTNAARRFPKKIKRVNAPEGKYDLIIATGVLYDHYDWETFRNWIDMHASQYVLVSHYDKVGKPHDRWKKTLITMADFPYRDGTQYLRLYKW